MATSVAAPRFYVEPRTVLAYFKQQESALSHQKKALGDKGWVNRREMMYGEIEMKVQSLSQKHPLYKFNDILRDVLMGEAPSFYINPNSAVFYYYRAIHNKGKR